MEPHSPQSSSGEANLEDASRSGTDEGGAAWSNGHDHNLVVESDAMANWLENLDLGRSQVSRPNVGLMYVPVQQLYSI
eukprot:SAG31_NODE_627_length_13445_cov_18.311053_10_plen_78_part_00